jgi:Rne/Rng family ribonuclease
MLMPPPQPWQRALADIKGCPSDLTFAEREDRAFCVAELAETNSPYLSSVRPLSKEPVHTELNEIIDDLLKPVVPLPGGGTIVIEPTEALVAIDVNSGSIAGHPLNINLRAAKESARQIRLRNLSGTIIIDCLKMSLRTDTNKLLDALKKATEDDPAGVNVFGMTKLGLVELTRVRRGSSLPEIIKEG